jgi:hypothetical protein
MGRMPYRVRGFDLHLDRSASLAVGYDDGYQAGFADGSEGC